jgi:hypothetical protein
MMKKKITNGKDFKRINEASVKSYEFFLSYWECVPQFHLLV